MTELFSNFFFYHDFGVVVRESEADRSHCKLNTVLVYTGSNSRASHASVVGNKLEV